MPDDLSAGRCHRYDLAVVEIDAAADDLFCLVQTAIDMSDADQFGVRVRKNLLNATDDEPVDKVGRNCHILHFDSAHREGVRKFLRGKIVR